MFGDPITSYILGKILDMLPNWISRRITPPSKIAGQIDVDLNRANPISLYLNQTNSYVELYFEIANASPVDINLDRLLINMWMGQPLVRDAVLERFDILKKTTRDDIWINIPLNDQHVNQIKSSLNSQRLIDQINLEISVYFDSKLGPLHIRKRLERRDVPLKAGPP